MKFVGNKKCKGRKSGGGGDREVKEKISSKYLVLYENVLSCGSTGNTSFQGLASAGHVHVFSPEVVLTQTP